MEKYSPLDIERLNKSRAKSDKELIQGGAELEFDGSGSYKLFLSDAQIERLRVEMNLDMENTQKKEFVTKEILKIYDGQIEAMKDSLNKQIGPSPTGYIQRITTPIRLQSAEAAYRDFGNLISREDLVTAETQERIGKLQVQSGAPTVLAGGPLKEMDFEKSAYEAVEQLDENTSVEGLRLIEDKLRLAALWALQYNRNDAQSRSWCFFSQEVLKLIGKAVEKNQTINLERIGFLELKRAILDYAGALHLDKHRYSMDLDIISEKVDMEHVLKSLAQTESVIFLSKADIDVPESK